LFRCTGIIKQHGGQLTVESDGLGKGSTFTVELPAFLCEYPTTSVPDATATGTDEKLIYVDESHAVVYGEQRDSSADLVGQSYSQSLTQVGSGDCSPDDAAPAGAVAVPMGAHMATGLPVSAVETSPPRSSPQTAATAAAEGDCSPVPARRVLIVDDVASNLKMTARLLQRGGVQTIEQATDGRIAVDTYVAARSILREDRLLSARQDRLEGGGVSELQAASSTVCEPYDYILMDFEMPVMNGPTATAQLRELGCTVPIIGVTGNVLPADVQYFLDSGANAVLPKPLKFAQLDTLWRK
jgi:CheY-like chemotaxis protein